MTIMIDAQRPHDASRTLRRAAARRAAALLVASIALGTGSAALAQDRGTLNPRPLPALAHPDDPKTPARELFARRPTAALATMHSRTIGFYAKGCLAGGMELPINGPTWQVMRLS